jgi:uncharacterized membrane-anchored protein
VTVLCLCLSPLGAVAQQASQSEQEKSAVFRSLQWQRGPTTVAVAGNSTLAVPEGYVFLDEKNTTKFLELSENIGSDSEVLVAPESLDWTAYLSFDPSGYVKDDETIDAAALLASLKEGTAAANAGPRRRPTTARPSAWNGPRCWRARATAMPTSRPRSLAVTATPPWCWWRTSRT